MEITLNCHIVLTLNHIYFLPISFTLSSSSSHTAGSLFLSNGLRMEAFYAKLHYLLVDNPTVSQFQWRQGETFASSLRFLNLAAVSYLSLTFILRRLNITPLPSSILKPVSAVHNMILLLVSLTMAVGVTLSTISQMPNLKWVVCFPTTQSPKGPVFFWAYVFYLSKFLEFIDTLLIILAGSNRRLSFLHVYHHAVVTFMCYQWISKAQSLFPIGIATNASVHVLMYAYYFACAIGKRPRWKRAVTNCQIAQFVFGFLISTVMIYHHLFGSGCSGIQEWCFNAVFNASLLALFVDFHSNNYVIKDKRL